MSKKKQEYDELTADNIFDLDDCEIEELNIDQWKGKVYMRTFSGTERAQMQEITSKVNSSTGKGGLELMIWVMIHGVCNVSGKRLFKYDTPTQDKLKNKKGSVVEAIARAIMEHNSLSATQEKVEKEAKNS